MQSNQASAGNVYPLTKVEISTKPWKYIGYKEFAKYMSSDDDSFTLRRFDRIHCRLLLFLQNRIVLLERKLDSLDGQLSERQAADIDNGCLCNEINERRDLLNDIHRAVVEYDELLVQFSQLKARPKPPDLVINNLEAWLQNAYDPICEKESEFLKASDLICFSEVKKSSARLFVEDKLLHPTRALWGLVSHKVQPDSAADEHTVEWDDDAVGRLAKMAIFLTALLMLVLPLWILALVSNRLWKLAIITLFLLCFVSVLTWATLARPFDILAATAGYSAVLVVFLQFGTGQ
ncbi:hypothetical protein GGR53DRAFT_506153 [Hypoxylon sp. FL1150]|nr:hypothetical protein GGR53DRAFT_506153 [Hypoxylon sp. FL1150]